MSRLLSGGILLLLSLLTLSAIADSPSPEPETGPAGLVLEPDRLDLSTVEAGASREVVAAWRRSGGGRLAVYAVRTGCGCAAAEGLAGVLEAGARGSLRVRLAARTEPGPFRVQVRAFTDAPPPSDVVTLRICGYVGTEASVRPAVLDVGPRSPGAEVEARFSIHLPSHLQSAASAAPVTAALVGLEGKVVVEAATFAGQEGPDLRVRLRCPTEEGPFAGTLVVRAGVGLAREVPLRGRVACAPPPPR